MKIRVANIFDKAARTILVAGTFSVPGAILAQTEPYRVLDKPASVSHGLDQASSVSPKAKDTRGLEMKVELAWLADPMTSGWRLDARTVGSTLEVHGDVPNETILRHALHLAQAESGMTVVSKVQLNPTLRAPTSSKPQDLLHREAFNALLKRFPGQAPSVTVSTRADGEIVLKGTIPTYEDKLAISRHLREATACSSVRNELLVLAEPKESFVRSSSRPAEATSNQGADAPRSPTPGTVQPVSHVPDPESVTAAPPHVPAKAEAANQHPPAEKQLTTTAKPAKPLVYQTKWRRMDPSEVAIPKRIVPGATSKEPVSATKPEATATASNTPHTFLRVIPSSNEEPKDSSGGSAPAKMEMAHLSKQTLQLRSNPLPQAVTSSDLPPGKSSHALAPPAYPAPAPVRAPLPPPLTVAKGEPYVSEGVIIVQSAIKPAGLSTSPATPKPPAVLRTGPYVTNGVILLSGSANNELFNSNPSLRALQTRLQQRIAAACGKSSNDIEVTATTETNVSVRVRARSTLEGEELSNRIFQLPELGPCQVSLDVVVIK